MSTRMMAVLAAGLAASACAPTVVPVVQPVPQPAPPPPDASFIPAASHLEVTLQEELNTTDTRVGDSFIVNVTAPLVAANGQIVVPVGTRIQGMVTGVARPGGRDPAALRLQFLRIELNEQWRPLAAEIAETHVAMDRRTDDTRHAQAAVAGAVTGATIGAIISGGRLRDALTGAAIGAGAGTIISLGMGTPTEAVLPAGTRMTLRMADRVDVR
jgi:hypothetical protein